jgi:5S rRNA maturation endonuclease (ribonuclease M5)
MTLSDIKEKTKDFEAILEELKTENLDHPVLVEGVRDKDALMELGLEGEIFILHSGKPLLAVCEGLAERYSTVLLMLDWDRKGKHLTKTVKQYLTTLGVKPIDKYMNKIFSLAQKETKEVEALDRFYERLCKGSKSYKVEKYTRVREFSKKRGRHP